MSKVYLLEDEMIIYKAVNKTNDKYYIGQTSREFNVRIKAHICEARTNKDNMIFHKALRKYGVENFEWSVLCECDNKEELNKKEECYIKEYNSVVPHGYNLTYGGEGCVGYKHSDEHKKYISKIGKGRKHTEEARKHMSEGQKGKKMPEAYKELRSEQMKGENNFFYGKTHTLETKEKLRKINLGKTQTEESNKKRSNKLKGRVLTEEHKKKLSDARKKDWERKEYRDYHTNRVIGKNNPMSNDNRKREPAE
jgi:group I intron endonuclease